MTFIKPNKPGYYVAWERLSYEDGTWAWLSAPRLIEAYYDSGALVCNYPGGGFITLLDKVPDKICFVAGPFTKPGE